MASAVVINKTDGSIVRKLSSTIRLEDITLAPNEILSWDEEFHSATPSFDWQSRIMKHGNAVATVHCTRGCKTTVDHVNVRIEGGDVIDVCSLMWDVYALLGESPTTLMEWLEDPMGWLRKKLSASRLRAFSETTVAGIYAVALVVVIALFAGALMFGPILWVVCAISGGVLGMGVTMRLWGWKPVFFIALGLAASKTLSVLYYNHMYHWSPFDVPDMILGPVLFFGCGLAAMLYCRRFPSQTTR